MPSALGVKCTETVQELLGASDVTQLLVPTEKSPVAVTLLISRMPAPLLVSVTSEEDAEVLPTVVEGNTGALPAAGNATAPESTRAGTSCAASGGAMRRTGVQVQAGISAGAGGFHNAVAALTRDTTSTTASGLLYRVSLTQMDSA